MRKLRHSFRDAHDTYDAVDLNALKDWEWEVFECDKPIQVQPIIQTPLPPTIEDKIIRTETCWTWVGAKDPRGYGYVTYNGKVSRAQRVIYQFYKGKIPDGLVLDHLCKNHSCVNPDHLEVVTQKENVLRGDSPLAFQARQTHCKRGHEFTPENTRIYEGRRYCNTCAKLHREGSI